MESDWSSRRKSAMNRARELRSKIHEMHDQRSIENGDDASNAIMSSREIQRQRRSRQLEETQRLLDQFADAEVDDNRRVSSNHSVRSGNVSLYRHGSIEAQVASSQELLGRNHGRDMYSADPNDYAAFEARQLDKKSSSQMIVAESRSVRETSLHRQRGQFGRGRGRGRSGSGGAMSSRQVASSLQSSTVASPRDNDAIEGYNRQGQERNNFSTSIESTPKPQCYYLRDLRVPEHKEGECDKLVVLRQRLAARRRMRELALEGKKGQTIELSKHGLEKSRVPSNAVPHEHSTQQHAKHFSHKDVDDSNRSYRSSYNNDAIQMNASTGSVSSNVSEKSVVNIELMKCDCCGRSFAPKVYEKHFDSNGQPKCANDKKRPVFNSAKARIANNSNLNQDEQMQVLQANKKVTKDLAKKKNGKGRSMEKIRRSSKWREESRAFRDAMKACRL